MLKFSPTSRLRVGCHWQSDSLILNIFFSNLLIGNLIQSFEMLTTKATEANSHLNKKKVKTRRFSGWSLWYGTLGLVLDSKSKSNWLRSQSQSRRQTGKQAGRKEDLNNSHTYLDTHSKKAQNGETEDLAVAMLHCYC